MFGTKETKLSLGILLSSLIILSCISSTSIFKQQVVAYSQQQPSFTATTNSSEKELSNMLLNQMKQLVFKYLSNSSSTFSSSNSSIPVSMVVGIVTPNGTQVSGYGNLSKANSTQVDGNTIFDIASITKIFATIVLADMVKQGLVNLNDPIEKYLPSNTIIKVPSYNGHKITLKHLATHTSGLPDFPEEFLEYLI